MKYRIKKTDTCHNEFENVVYVKIRKKIRAFIENELEMKLENTLFKTMCNELFRFLSWNLTDKLKQSLMLL